MNAVHSVMRRVAGLALAVAMLVPCALPTAMAAAAPPGDIFSTGSPPNPYGSGNTTRRTGKQAQQDDSVYCQQTPDGREIPKPYGGTRRNIPCGLPGAGPSVPPPRPAPCKCPTSNSAGTPQARAVPADSAESCACPSQPVPIFHYYYINGINTPLDGQGRGSYRWDFRMIRANLLDIDKTPVGFAQRPRSPSSLKVAANERNVFDVETYNLSGTQAIHQRDGACDSLRIGRIKLPAGLQQLAELACAIEPDDPTRASKLGGMSPGDVLESLFQSNLRTTNSAATEYDVIRWSKMMRTIYENERPDEKHYFILIAHSQGNFFAEGMAYRLSAGWEDASGRAIYQQRLGILSLASPTDYDSLLDDFRQRRIRHYTRVDDGIRTLSSLPFGAKRPWDRQPTDPPSLWPWSKSMLEERLRLATLPCWPISLKCSPFLETLGMSPEARCEPPTDPVCNGALYTPLMNSHLIDNYLTDPPLTMPGKPVNPKVLAYIPWLDPSAGPPFKPPPVLTEVRTGLKQLKCELLSAGKSRC